MLKSKAVMFAEAFLYGTTKGDWALSADVAGYAKLPEKTNVYIHKAIDGLKDKVQRVEVAEEVERTKGTLDWAEAADEISPVMLQIATGEIRASPAQQRALEHIIQRGQGKVVEKQKKIESPGVVVLPTLGQRENATVCPNCLSEL
jgi:hypothetical protein